MKVTYEMNHGSKHTRDSNLELYRIIVMLLIIAHHYVVNSGVLNLMYQNPFSGNSIYMFILGAWGKIGINCYIFITGYFMCEKSITLNKYMKLILEVLTYNFVISVIFAVAGEGKIEDILKGFIIVRNIDSSNFTASFLMFYLLIPFLNVLIHNIDKKQHQFLIGVLSFLYVVLGTIPKFGVTMNYVSWFSYLFLVSSYVRIYQIKKRNWGLLTLLFVILSVFSIIFCLYIGEMVDKNIAYRFVTDSNTFLALAVGFCSFMYFSTLNIKSGKLINLLGGSTFGILLIHTNSDLMRNWLWGGVCQVQETFEFPLTKLIFISLISVMGVFSACAIIEIIRQKLIEKRLLNWIQTLGIYKNIETWTNEIIFKI